MRLVKVFGMSIEEELKEIHLRNVMDSLDLIKKNGAILTAALLASRESKHLKEVLGALQILLSVEESMRYPPKE